MVVRRVRVLERVFAVEPEEWIDVLLWVGSESGIFGHAHHRFTQGGKQTEQIPCPDEEKIAIMRTHYEEDGHKFYGKGSDVSFAEYLEHFSYLGPEELAARRNVIIEELKGEEIWSRS